MKEYHVAIKYTDREVYDIVLADNPRQFSEKMRQVEQRPGFVKWHLTVTYGI